MELTPKDIKKYHQDKQKRHAYYEDSVEKYEEIDLHVEGEKPSELIEKSRPNESEEMRKYRVDSFEPLTKSTVWRVFNSLGKIRKSKDWAIKYDITAVPPRVIEKESPQAYLSYNFPKYGSVENWFFSIGLTEMLTDANAFVAVHPKNFHPAPNEYFQPIPIIYNSDDVIDYAHDEYFVMESGEVNVYKFNYGRNQANGAVYYVYTPTEVIKFGQISNNEDFAELDRYQHNFGYIPCFQMKGVVTEDNYFQTLCESRIATMIPHLNQVVRMQSDFTHGVTAHCYPTRWYYATQMCMMCNGKAIMKTDKGGTKPCPQCKGTGSFAPKFGEDIIVSPPEPGANSAPTPPGGEIQKDFTAIDKLNTYIDQYTYKALSAINFQFLDNTPLNQSGVAKEVDRDELNVFVHSIAIDSANIIRFVSKCCVDYRYQGIVPNPDERAKLVPTISVPDRFDLMSANTLIGDIKSLKDAGVDASIVNAAQVEYAAKAYATDPTVKDKLTLKLKLDPFAGTSDEALLTAQQFGSVSDIDVKIHFNIGKYIDQALETVKDFAGMDIQAQKAEIVRLANADVMPEQAPAPNPLMP